MHVSYFLIFVWKTVLIESSLRLSHLWFNECTEDKDLNKKNFLKLELIKISKKESNLSSKKYPN